MKIPLFSGPLPGLGHPLPLRADEGGRFLPAIVAIMTLLALLALAGALAVNRGAQAWDKEVTGTATVQVLPGPDAAEVGRRVEAAVKLLEAQPGVLLVRPLPPEAGAALVAPWLGELTGAAELPIPRLIAVSVDPAVAAQDAIRQALTAVPGTRYQDHLTWLEPIRRAAAAARGLAVVILGVIGGAAVLTVLFATRTALAVQQDVIEVLHLIGARDGYIAAGLARQTMGRALLGALIGAILAVAVLLTLPWLVASAAEAPALLRGVALAPLDWLWIALLPLALSALAAAAAYLAALRGLARWP